MNDQLQCPTSRSHTHLAMAAFSIASNGQIRWPIASVRVEFHSSSNITSTGQHDLQTHRSWQNPPGRPDPAPISRTAPSDLGHRPQHRSPADLATTEHTQNQIWADQSKPWLLISGRSLRSIFSHYRSQ
ncbi:hypothetical protein ACLOJK_028419 [Asimina triloba]